MSYRLISRAILVPFKEVCDRSAEDQDALDIELDEAMKDAQGAAGLIISLGNDLVQNRQEPTSSITPRIEKALPGAINRVHRSYALATFAVLKVTIYHFKLYKWYPLLLQLLDKLVLREKYEVVIWNFIQTAVSEAVSVFQTQTLPPQSVSTSAAPFTGQQLGDLILQAVSGKTPAEV